MREDPLKNVNVKGVNKIVSFLRKLMAIVAAYHILVILGALVFAFGLFYAISARRPDTLQYLKNQYNKTFVIESKDVNNKKDGTYIVYPKDNPEIKVTLTRYRYRYTDNYIEKLIEYCYNKEKDTELFSGFNLIKKDSQPGVVLEKEVYNVSELKSTAGQIYDLKLYFKDQCYNLQYNAPIRMKYKDYVAYLWIQDAGGNRENLEKKAIRDYISYLKANNYSLKEISDEDLENWFPEKLAIKINGEFIKDFSGENNYETFINVEKQEHTIFLYQVLEHINGVTVLKKSHGSISEFEYNGNEYIISNGKKPWFRKITPINSALTMDEFKEIFNATIELDYENEIVNIKLK